MTMSALKNFSADAPSVQFDVVLMSQSPLVAPVRVNYLVPPVTISLIILVSLVVSSVYVAVCKRIDKRSNRGVVIPVRVAARTYCKHRISARSASVGGDGCSPRELIRPISTLMRSLEPVHLPG